MKIAYVAHVNDGNGSGVILKMAAQADQWRRHGHDVRLLVATRDRDTTWQSRLGDSVIERYGNWSSRLRAMDSIARQASRYGPDVVYMRFDLFYPSMLWMARGAALVVEVNTDDRLEYALGSRRREIYNARTRGLILRRARAVVFVTAELSRSASFHGFDGHRAVIPNGIDLAAYPELPAPVDRRPRLVFVGSLSQPWQGTDKVMKLASLCREWQFDIVGEGDAPPDVPDNVTWHGRLARPEVLRVLATADVGIGTLALHRKGMEEACPLKVREYLAVGLPVLYACADLDADIVEAVTLRIANTESNVSDEHERIVEFVRHVKGMRASRASVAHIDAAFKEEQRLTLFRSIAIP